MDLPIRPRRNRRTPAIRSLLQETRLHPDDLVQPLFLIESPEAREAIPSLPDIHRLGLESMKQECETLEKSGIRAVALFPVFEDTAKDPEGSISQNPGNYFYRSLRELKRTFPDLCFFVDVALDPYTSHGHDGILDDRGDVDNDRTVEALCTIAALLAECGTDYVAPSDMMDGRIGAIRSELDRCGHGSTGIMAYAAKFASACYGPFRDAVRSGQQTGYLDKTTYQLNYTNSREAARELRFDEEEGADILMVKPANWYGDILCRARQSTTLPLAAYQVSGEYSMIHAAADQGWMELESAREESLIAIKRAGADLIFTYFAKAWARDASHSR